VAAAGAETPSACGDSGDDIPNKAIRRKGGRQGGRKEAEKEKAAGRAAMAVVTKGGREVKQE
jgi:hypothetical protein